MKVVHLEEEEENLEQSLPQPKLQPQKYKGGSICGGSKRKGMIKAIVAKASSATPQKF